MHKRSIIQILSLFVFVLALYAWSANPFVVHAEEEPDYIMILMDVSGSMKYKLGGGILSIGTPKIDVARQTLAETLPDIHEDTAVAFSVFGTKDTIDHRIKCTAVETPVGFGTENGDDIVAAAEQYDPTGATPMAYALEQAKEVLQKKSGVRRIILIGDGEETCDGDVGAIAEELADMDIPVDAFFLGKDLGEASDLQLAANTTGGDFFQSADGANFSDALKAALGMGEMPADAPGSEGDMPLGGLAAETLDVFETKCQRPAKIGDQVLYQEYDLVGSEENESSGLEIILDMSGSMEGSVSGEKKIVLARSALTEAVNAIPEHIDVALRAYGHRILKSNKTESCTDTELLVNFGDPRTEVYNRANDYDPRGWTPIQYALEQALEDLKDYDKKQIILISDGEETCGGDPVGMAQALKDQGIEVTMHTVGFDVDAVTAAQLRSIAEASGGTYVDAGSAEELTAGLGRVVEESAREDQDCPTLYTNPVGGGPSLEEAKEIAPGTYTFDKFLEKNEYYFYKVPVKSGQLVKIYAHAARPHVKGSPEDGYKEIFNDQLSAFRINVYDEDKNTSRKRDPILAFTRSPLTQLNIAILKDGYIYLEMGYNMGDVHQDNIFSIQVEDHPDGDTGRDVSLDNKGTLLEETRGGLGFEDAYDAFTVPKALQGKTLSVDFGDPGYRSHLEVFGKDGKLRTDKKVEEKGSITLPNEDDLTFVMKNTSPINAEIDTILKSRGRYAEYTITVGGPVVGERTAAPTESEQTVDETDAKEKKGFPWLMYGVLVILGIIVIAGAGYLLFHKKEETPPTM